MLQDYFVGDGVDHQQLRVLGVCDGHYGRGAAAFVSCNFVKELQERVSIDCCAGKLSLWDLSHEPSHRFHLMQAEFRALCDSLWWCEQIEKA